MKATNITDDVVAAMFDWAARWPGASMPTSFKFFQLGRKINEMKPTDTADGHRGFDWPFTIKANWWRPTDSVPRVEANLDWQKNFYADINKRAGAVGAFQNFSDPTLENWPEAYYRENYKKLMKMKKAVDPTCCSSSRRRSSRRERAAGNMRLLGTPGSPVTHQDCWADFSGVHEPKTDHHYQ